MSDNEELDEFDRDLLESDEDIDEDGRIFKKPGRHTNTENEETVAEPTPYTLSTAHILSGYGADLASRVLAEFIKLEVGFSDLQSLSDKDLEMMGVTSAVVRKEMMTDFAMLPNQGEYLNMRLTALLADRPNNNMFLDNINKHLENLKIAIVAAQMKLQTYTPENILIDNHTYSTEALMATLEEINLTCLHMKRTLVFFQTGQSALYDYQATDDGPSWSKILLIGTLSFSGIVLLRYFRHSIINFFK